MRETNQTDKLGRSGEPDKQTKIVRRSNRQIRLFVSVCLVTTLARADSGCIDQYLNESGCKGPLGNGQSVPIGCSLTPCSSLNIKIPYYCLP